jgi:hypothetical protein
MWPGQAAIITKLMGPGFDRNQKNNWFWQLRAALMPAPAFHRLVRSYCTVVAGKFVQNRNPLPTMNVTIPPDKHIYRHSGYLKPEI